MTAAQHDTNQLRCKGSQVSFLAEVAKSGSYRNMQCHLRRQEQWPAAIRRPPQEKLSADQFSTVAGDVSQVDYHFSVVEIDYF